MHCSVFISLLTAKFGELTNSTGETFFDQKNGGSQEDGAGVLPALCCAASGRSEVFLLFFKTASTIVKILDLHGG